MSKSLWMILGVAVGAILATVFYRCVFGVLNIVEKANK